MSKNHYIKPSVYSGKYDLYVLEAGGPQGWTVTKVIFVSDDISNLYGWLTTAQPFHFVGSDFTNTTDV